jgi:hypothetical protein
MFSLSAYFNSAVSKTSVCNNYTLQGKFLLLMMLYLWTRLRVGFNAYMSILVSI